MRHATLPLLVLLLLVTSSRSALHAEDAQLPEGMAVIERRVLEPLRTSKGRKLSYPGSQHLTKARRSIAAGRTREALASLDAWLDLDYRHSNWWVNHVPIPRAVGEIALLLRDDLGEKRRARVDRVLVRAWPPPRGGIGVGANLFYRTDAAVLKALLARDADLLESIFRRAADEIRITKGEGIQEDLSFHQHGPQLYTGSYGLEYIRGAIRIAQLAEGTRYALPREKVDLLLSLLLDGLQWMTHGPMIDPGAQGRNFSRQSAGRGGRTVAGFCKQLLALDVPRRTELAAYAKNLGGNRCFWRSDFMVHRRPGWYLSTKMASVRTVGTESGNGEGLKQYHLADGACFVLRRGDEYDGVQPVWDWRRVPGTTCELVATRLPTINWGRGARGTTRFVGGASDGEHGVATMHLKKAGIRARKAWFYFGEQLVALGAGIRSEGENTVVTSINQCLARTQVRKGDGWAHHDGVGYVVLGGALDVRIEMQFGTWRSINRGLSAEAVEREVFSALVDHGRQPQGAGYAYVVLPDASAERVSSYAATPSVEVLANSERLQAVRHEGLGLTGIVFHEAGAMAGVTVDRPCVVLIKTDDSGLRISLADPAQRSQPVHLMLEAADQPLRFEPRDGRTQMRTVPR